MKTNTFFLFFGIRKIRKKSYLFRIYTGNISLIEIWLGK